MNKKNYYIAVYGSLRRGMGNHRLIEDSEFLETAIIHLPYRMISLGGFPGLVPINEDEDLVPITVEFYKVNADVNKRVEMLEGYPTFYDKYWFDRNFGGDNEEVCIYVLPGERYSSNNIVSSGDWVDFYRKRYSYNSVRS